MVEIANKDRTAIVVGVATGFTTALIGGTPDTAIQMAVGGYLSGRLFVEFEQLLSETMLVYQ